MTQPVNDTALAAAPPDAPPDCSPSIVRLLGALVLARKSFKPARKTNVNAHFAKDRPGGAGGRYADLADINEAVEGPLLDQGLVVLQPLATYAGSVVLRTLLCHAPSGEWMASTFPISPVKNDPQSYGSAITYARRYAVCAMLDIVADEDDDGNRASRPQPPQQQQQRQAPPANAPQPAQQAAAPTAAGSPAMQHARRLLGDARVAGLVATIVQEAQQHLSPEDFALFRAEATEAYTALYRAEQAVAPPTYAGD